MPAGIGLHPWFRRPVALRVPAEVVYPANTESARDPIPVAGAHDLRVARVPDAGLDGTWTALAAPRIELAWPQAGIAREHRGRRRRACSSPSPRRGHLDAVAVEPQTHGPDGLRRLEHGEPDALVLLPPGESLSLTVRITVERVSLSR